MARTTANAQQRERAFDRWRGRPHQNGRHGIDRLRRRCWFPKGTGQRLGRPSLFAFYKFKAMPVFIELAFAMAGRSAERAIPDPKRPALVRGVVGLR